MSTEQKTFIPAIVARLRDPEQACTRSDIEALTRDAADEIMRLRERLEIGYAFDGEGNRVAFDCDDYDGIACRDETIKGLDEQLRDAHDAIPDTPEFDWLAGMTLAECIEALVKGFSDASQERDRLQAMIEEDGIQCEAAHAAMVAAQDDATRARGSYEIAMREVERMRSGIASLEVIWWERDEGHVGIAQRFADGAQDMHIVPDQLKLRALVETEKYAEALKGWADRLAHNAVYVTLRHRNPDRTEIDNLRFAVEEYRAFLAKNSVKETP